MHYLNKHKLEQKAWYEAHKDTLTHTELSQGAFARPASKEQRDELMQLVEDMKERMAKESESIKMWHERMYEQQASRYDR